MSPTFALILMLLAVTAMLAFRAVRPQPAPPGAASRAPGRGDTLPGPLLVVEPAPPPLDPQRAGARDRVRDRYLAARFPSLFRECGELADTGRVVKAARLFFEEDRLDLAYELLGLAIRQFPGDEALRLAQLEIVFLARDATQFAGLAAAFRSSHPHSSHWDEVARLGHAIAPSVPLFGGDGSLQAGSRYGPWPEMPNWIEASWDLASDVLASDFHRAMTRPAPIRPALRHAA